MSENFTLLANELMRLYLTAPVEENYAYYLDLLLENHALPVIKNSLARKIQESRKNGFYTAEQDFEDLCSESCLRIVEKLSGLRDLSDRNSILDFESYAAVVAYNTFSEFLSNGTPHWKSLKNKIRYAVKNSTELEMWVEANEIFCGLVHNKRQFRPIPVDDLVVRVEDEVENFRNIALTDLLFEILERANSKIRLNELVSIAARLWAIEDLPDVSLNGFLKEILPSGENQQNNFEMRFTLEQIWQEIRQLPVNQRIALLYNLRDENGREMLFMIFNARIATLDEIAEAMNLSLEDFAKLLPLLPLEDKVIAERMNLTIKRIGDLRKAARENLLRRLAGKPKRQSRMSETNKAHEEETNENNFDPALGES